MICQSCGKDSEDVVECLDPYALEINDEEVEVVLCPDCLQDRADDI
jgi:hypothetical protein